MKQFASPNVISDLKDLHRGLHVAMDSLIKSKDYPEAEVVLRQLDDRLTHLINIVVPID